MEPQALDIVLSNGSAILVETERSASPGGLELSGKDREDLAARAVRSAPEIFAQIGVLVGDVRAGLVDALPDELEVEFSVKLSAEAGVLITRTSAEGTFRVCAKWKKD